MKTQRLCTERYFKCHVSLGVSNSKRTSLCEVRVFALNPSVKPVMLEELIVVKGGLGEEGK